jgi:hypothetical protein
LRASAATNSPVTASWAANACDRLCAARSAASLAWASTIFPGLGVLAIANLLGSIHQFRVGLGTSSRVALCRNPSLRIVASVARPFGPPGPAGPVHAAACPGATARRLAQLFWLLGRVHGVVPHFICCLNHPREEIASASSCPPLGAPPCMRQHCPAKLTTAPVVSVANPNGRMPSRSLCYFSHSPGVTKTSACARATPFGRALVATNIHNNPRRVLGALRGRGVCPPHDGIR